MQPVTAKENFFLCHTAIDGSGMITSATPKGFGSPIAATTMLTPVD